MIKLTAKEQEHLFSLITELQRSHNVTLWMQTRTGLSRKRLSQLSGISQPTLSNLHHQKYKPSRVMVSSLAMVALAHEIGLIS